MAIFARGRFAELRDASFRGAPFEVESRELAGGRRLARHEYPLRDTPFAEDLGRKAREYPVEAFIVEGRRYSYAQARDALIDALNGKGPGTLIHPSLGEMTVAVDSFRLKESSREGGYCTFSITFVEAGQAENPGSAQNTAQIGAARAAAARSASLDAFLARYIALPQWLEQGIFYVNNAISLVCECMALPQALLAYGSAVVNGLLLKPSALAGALGGLFPAETLSGAGARHYDFAPLAPVFAAAYDPYFITPDPFVSPGPLLAAQIATQGVISAAWAAMLTDFATADEALAMREAVLSGIDAAADYAPDSLFGPLSDLRLATAVDLTTRGAQLPRISHVELSAAQPALVAAYTVYGDAGRDLEIVARNGVRHPGRVPGGVPLEVLSG
jgi:prophage DNA circulation protein